MDEDFVKQAFSAMGESPTGVKIITHRITGWVLTRKTHTHTPSTRPVVGWRANL